MMASAVRVDFEFRSAFASRKTSPSLLDYRRAAMPKLACGPRDAFLTGPLRRSRGVTRLSGVGALLQRLATKQSRPARLEGLLHVDVRLRQLAAPLENLGVNTVCVKQLFSHSKSLKATDRFLELVVSSHVIATPV
jgi:hypothetical protein